MRAVVGHQALRGQTAVLQVGAGGQRTFFGFDAIGFDYDFRQRGGAFRYCRFCGIRRLIECKREYAEREECLIALS
jgi:hypothetical protein